MTTKNIAELQHNLIQAQKDTIQAQLKMIEILANNVDVMKKTRKKVLSIAKSKPCK